MLYGQPNNSLSCARLNVKYVHEIQLSSSTFVLYIVGGYFGNRNGVRHGLAQTVKERCFTVPVDKIQIVQASLGSKAGMIGASIWAAQRENT
jgi:hypothetical protein